MRLLRQAVAPLEFSRLPGQLFLSECQICWAVVDQSSKGLHMDWHDKVHAGLVELGKLLK
jgi:hypothetical protein